MKYFIPFLILLLSCSKDETKKGVPQCIADKIEDFQNNPGCPYSQVDEYVFQGKKVYVFNNDRCCCDYTSDVFSMTCENLGYLGGFVGNTTINGENFLMNAQLIRTLWKQ